MRVVLLGNSWSRRNAVGNIIAGAPVFSTNEDHQGFHKVRSQLADRELILINTPNLLLPNISEEQLTQDVQDLVLISSPGPHVFLLVLQPETFTKEDEARLLSILENYSNQSFNHSLLLISPREKHHVTIDSFDENPPFKEILNKCRAKIVWDTNLEQKHILLVMTDIVSENGGRHVTSDVFGEAPLVLTSDLYTSRRTYSSDPEAGTDELRILLFGKSDDQNVTCNKIITGKKETFFGKLYVPRTCQIKECYWNNKRVEVVKTQDLFSLPGKTLLKEMNTCVNLCSPGPNVLLLAVKSSDFTVKNRKTLDFILSLFGPHVFRHAMVIITQDMERNCELEKLIQQCNGRHHSITTGKTDHGNCYKKLMQKIEDIVIENTGRYLKINHYTEPKISNPPLNLVLFGSHESLKTSAANAILEKRIFDPALNPPACDKTQAEVFGRRVSLVRLPALNKHPGDKAMKESLNCVSLCGAVHAFILVLPFCPLTNGSKDELKTIQDIFSSQINEFIVILFAVESEPRHLNVDNFMEKNKDVKELCQSFEGRYVVLNIKGKPEIPKLLEIVEQMKARKRETYIYTSINLLEAQMNRVLQLKEKNKMIQDEHERMDRLFCDDQQSSDCLRIVLIGKTGCGKSSSGNTILGRDAFKADSGQMSVTKFCQKEHGEVDGRHVVIVDTPGLFDSTLSSEEIQEEMVKCVSLLAPGPHVFLLVFQVPTRLTPEEKGTLKRIKKLFGKNSEKFTIVLLTGGDKLQKEKSSHKEYIENKCDDSFKKLINDCGGRCHVFNNDDEMNQTQVSQLIVIIDKMVKENGGKCFTNEMLQKAEEAIKKKMQQILKEKKAEMEKEMAEFERKHKETTDELEKQLEKQREEIKQEKELKDKKLQEMEDKIKTEKEQQKQALENIEKERKERERQEEGKRKDFEKKIASLDKQIQSQEGEKKAVEGELEESREKLKREQEAWEKQQEEWWDIKKVEDEQKQKEEQIKIKTLEDKYTEERQEYEKQKEEEDLIRKELEEKVKHLKKTNEKSLMDLKKKHEDEARKQAEEFNDFKEEKMKELEEQKQENIKQMNDLIRRVTKNKENKKRIRNLLKKQEKEQSKGDDLQQKHEEELSSLLQEILNKEFRDESSCSIL